LPCTPKTISEINKLYDATVESTHGTGFDLSQEEKNEGGRRKPWKGPTIKG
jgi:hypothetical protein